MTYRDDRRKEFRIKSVGLDEHENIREVQVVVSRLAIFNRMVQICPDLRYANVSFPRHISVTVAQVRALLAWSGGVTHDGAIREGYDQAGPIYDALSWVISALED